IRRSLTSYPPDSMFVTQRAAKTRELLISIGLLGAKCGRKSAPVPTTCLNITAYENISAARRWL
ncbi:MAG: hypothetical protein PVI77_18370, partial [Desulfobacterales bacterium]